MGFRFRKRTRLFAGFHLNWSKNGLSSISIGRPGATWNLPIARTGSERTTVGIPGTGLSYSRQQSVRERQQRQRQAPDLPTTEATIEQVLGAMVGPECGGDRLWHQGLVERVLNDPDTPRKIREATILIRSPEAVELHLRRARGPAATISAAQQILQATQRVLAYTEELGWSQSID